MELAGACSLVAAEPVCSPITENTALRPLGAATLPAPSWPLLVASAMHDPNPGLSRTHLVLPLLPYTLGDLASGDTVTAPQPDDLNNRDPAQTARGTIHFRKTIDGEYQIRGLPCWPHVGGTMRSFDSFPGATIADIRCTICRVFDGDFFFTCSDVVVEELPAS